MYDFFKDHAYKNVWCTPDQDTQVILELAKLTPYNGAKSRYKVAWRTQYLPDQTNQWHIYQIGQVHPLILGLFPKTNEWVSFAETSNRQKMICDIYSDLGIQIPRVETFYIHNEDRNILVAVKKNTKLSYDFNNDKVYLRLYSNEFFNSQRAHNVNDFIYVEGGRYANNTEIVALQNSYETHAALNGQTYAFVNGRKVHAINLFTVAVGDVAEFVYDSSVEKVVDFKLSDLLDFTSTLDSKKKYLLHYDGVDTGTINYQDDVDIFVFRDLGSGQHTGVYYHKNNADAMRNLTHRDYSIGVGYVSNYVNKIKSFYPETTLINPEDIYVRIHIRKSGYDRDLVFETNRIHELYKLGTDDIEKAMLGIDSTVINWRAETLENAGYTKIMRSLSKNITNELVQNAYGYNALSKISADTPVQTYDFSGFNAANVPYLLQKGCTCYEYNSEGVLLNWSYHASGPRYICTNPLTTHVEMFSGKGGNYLNEVYGFDSTPYSRELDFRVYECGKTPGVVDNKFIDVTGRTDKYVIESNRIFWIEESPFRYPMVRFNSDFLAYDTTANMLDGQLKLTLNHLQRRNNTLSNWVMNVPMGELDVFMNDHSLIRNLDYVYKFPEIFIINKSHLVDPNNQPQRFHIRFTGFCKSDLSLSEVVDVGFIEHEVLSNNNRFDIRDDKVLRITVDGKLKTRNDFVFSELHSGVNMLSPLNGTPYQIKDIVAPLRGLATADTYALRDQSLITDKTVSDYLSLKIPQPERPALSAIPNRYEIFSPFICKILYDLALNRLILENKIYTKQEVMKICKDYEYLLAFDPTQEEQSVNSNYVIIHPHSLTSTIGIVLNKYRFLNTVVLIYTNNLVTLSPFVEIIPDPDEESLASFGLTLDGQFITLDNLALTLEE